MFPKKQLSRLLFIPLTDIRMFPINSRLLFAQVAAILSIRVVSSGVGRLLRWVGEPGGGGGGAAVLGDWMEVVLRAAALGGGHVACIRVERVGAAVLARGARGGQY